MSDRQRLVDDLIRDEGLRLKPYMDAVGKITIGVGRNLSDVGLSSREVMDLLGHDIDEAVTDLATFPWYLTLDEVRQRAMTNLRFNLGPRRFRDFKRMIRAMSDGDYQKAGAAMRDSPWYDQVKARATRLVSMILTGKDS